jgi:predicted dinucleotide-binding enzyme
VTAAVMVQPALVEGPHTVFVAGDDAAAKAEVGLLLQELGWPAGSIMDLGDISAARGMEMYLALWLRLWGTTGSAVLNVEVRAGE